MKSEITSLLSRVSSGDNSAFTELSAQYTPLIRGMAKRYANMSGAADETQVSEDFIQEATFALYRAAMTYESKSGEVSFGLYAKICIRNALVSELRRMSRKKKADREQERDAETNQRDPEGFADSAAVARILEGGLLSPFEKKVFGMYVNGVKVGDIAIALDRQPKSVSNAVFRIKSKLRLSLGSDVE